jgi:Flp pilus assembly protein TadD
MDILLKFRKPIVILILALITLIAGRGLISRAPLAGHDAAAYPVNQVQFMENLRAGVLFPRWSPDTRYGYGQPQLQFRPPLLHYLASPIHAATGNPFLALHLALLVSLFMAAWGAYALARLRVGDWAALAAAAGFVCANYMLANLYLRGAYYEVIASAAMPWILWAQSRENAARRSACLIGPVAWAALFMGHPAVAFFFFPLTTAHALSEARLLARSDCAYPWRILVFSSSFLVIGALLSAPYTWVMLSERSWVRMEIFLSDLNSWRRHFLSLRDLFTERWPTAYVEFSGVDYLNRALHPEMRGLNFWAIAVLIFSPAIWWLALGSYRTNKGRVGQPCPTGPDGGTGCPALPRSFLREKLFYAVFFYTAAWLSIAFSLRISLPVWDHIPLMDTFNYPWRALNIAGLCLALATAYTLALLNGTIIRRGYRPAGAIIAALFILAPLAEAIPHSKGWAGPAWLTNNALTSTAIRRQAGIPQQFYTPAWAQSYATEPAQTGAMAVAGTATVTVIERHPTRWRLRVEASAPAQIALAHYYYPGWRIHGLAGGTIETKPWGERGLISFAVPAGAHEIEARFGSTPARRAANFTFFAGLALMLLGVLLPRKSGSNLTLILNSVEKENTATTERGPPLQSGESDGNQTARSSLRSQKANFGGAGQGRLTRPSQNTPYLSAGACSAGAVVLLVGAIILTDYLVRARDDESRAIQARRQLAEGETKAAIRSFAHLLRERETDIAARYNLGAAYHNYGWQDEALASYNNVLNLANEYAARAAHSAARISIARKDFESARRYYEEALRHQPNAKDIRAEYEQLMLMRRFSGAATKLETRNSNIETNSPPRPDPWPSPGRPPVAEKFEYRNP